MNQFTFSGVVANIEFKKTNGDKEFVQLQITNNDTKWATDLMATYWDKLPFNVEPGTQVTVIGTITSRPYNERIYNDHRITEISVAAAEDNDLY